MYKFINNDNTYANYQVIETTTFNSVEINNPLELKLFNNDSFNLPNEIVDSPVRNNNYITGILILNKTYGKHGKKFLYLCQPYDNKLPFFLIPYEIPISFDKTLNNIYITFKFTNWENKYPYGTILQNIGSVDKIDNFYEYMMNNKNLNVSIKYFTKNIHEILHKNIIDDIILKYNIPFVKDKIITIDSPNSYDLDDGISINNNVISIYISHVAIIIDYLNIWNLFTERISNIYLPNKKYNMLPSALAQVCSLNKGETKICLKIDFNTITDETNISVCAVKINNNYYYDDEKLNTNDIYIKLKQMYQDKTSSQIIEMCMIKCNTICTEYMKKYKNGIYKCIQNNEILSNSYYENYNEKSNYLTITSPIRRLVDILNIYKLCKNINLILFNNEEYADTFYLNWINKLEYINTSSKNVRKIQSVCKILNICNNNNHNMYLGNIFDKIKINNKYKYQVYLPELNVYSKFYYHIELDEKISYMFKLFIFHNEGSFKNKIKLDIII
jgi:exoribonuclease R